MESTLRQTLSVSCMFMWIILAALCFGAVFDGLGAVHAIRFLFLDEWGLGPWEVIILMQLSFLIMGMFLDDTAMLVIVAPLYIPLVIIFGIRSDLVRRAVYHQLPDRLHDAAVWLQSVSDAGDGAQGDHACADIYRSIIPFVLVMMLGMAIIMAFPQIALWLPQWYYGHDPMAAERQSLAAQKKWNRNGRPTGTRSTPTKTVQGGSEMDQSTKVSKRDFLKKAGTTTASAVAATHDRRALHREGAKPDPVAAADLCRRRSGRARDQALDRCVQQARRTARW